MKVCIVSSSGGHLTEIQMLHEEYLPYDRCYVLNHPIHLEGDLVGRTEFITHAERDWKVLRNLWEAKSILARHRPDVILSTGAGPAVPFAIVGKTLGIPTIYIETFTRVASLSLTGRLIYPFARWFFVQWPDTAVTRKRAEVIGPLIAAEPLPELPRAPGQLLNILVTVGNALQPFERIISWTEHAVRRIGSEMVDVFVQHGTAAPPAGNWARRSIGTVSRSEFQELLHWADVVVTHAGAGTIIDALRAGKRPLVVPRVAKFGEHVDDHQLQLVAALAQDRMVEWIRAESGLVEMLRESSKGTAPVKAGLNPRAAECLRSVLKTVAHQS